jgi:streptogramin lyase
VGEPWGTAVDRRGNIWFAEPGCDFEPTCPAGTPPGQIGELKASSHTVVLHTLPDIPGNQPIFLAFDPSGNLWFTTPDNSKIGEFDPVTGKFVGQWSVTQGSGPWDLAFSNGTIWYTEHLVSAVGAFNPLTHQHRDFTTPSVNSNPYGIAADGPLIWFAENNSSVDRVAVLHSASPSDSISEYPIVHPLSGTPHMVTIGPNGHPWWTEGWSDTIATLDPGLATPGQCGTTSGVCKGVQRFALPRPARCLNGAHASGIAFDLARGLVWLDNSLTTQLGSFDPTTRRFALRTLSNCNAHPHDGLKLGLGDTVWFDEEFANALGELIPSASFPQAPALSFSR